MIARVFGLLLLGAAFVALAAGAGAVVTAVAGAIRSRRARKDGGDA